MIVPNAMNMEDTMSNMLMNAMIRWYVVESFSWELKMTYKIKPDDNADSEPVTIGMTKPAMVVAVNGLYKSYDCIFLNLESFVLEDLSLKL